MLKSLALENFKNFRQAQLSLGDLTLLVGTNASGKSNLRDAFRFLHGISRGYTLAEIIGEKWIEGGVLQWKGIRGGTREVATWGQTAFSLTAEFQKGARYSIEVELPSGQAPRVVREALHLHGASVFDSQPVKDAPQRLCVQFADTRKNEQHGQPFFLSSQPVLTQVASDDQPRAGVRGIAKGVVDALSSMRFLDLAPDAMRLPSLPGQTVLGDRGENLSSVLQAIVADADSKRALLEWIKELTPLDVVNFEFIPDQTGKVLVSLVESGGQRTSAYSASDGTLRFLAMIAALLGPSPARFYFFEELDNGIHPTRLHLLLQLIEQRVAGGAIQMVATSHSPQLLGFLSAKARESASLVYRLPGESDARITRILDIPEARSVLEKQDLARLHASGWLEDAVAFLQTADAGAVQ